MTNEQNKIIEVSYLDILNLLIFLKKKKHIHANYYRTSILSILMLFYVRVALFVPENVIFKNINTPKCD